MIVCNDSNYLLQAPYGDVMIPILGSGLIQWHWYSGFG